MEIATNVKLNPLYIVDRQDEIEFVHRAATVIKSMLNRDGEQKQLQLGTTKMRLELADIIVEFENTLNKRIEDLKLKLKESNNHRECNVFLNEIDTLESVLCRLSDLKLGDKELWKKYRAC